MQALVCCWCAGGAKSSFMRQVCADGSLTRTYFILLPRPLRPYGLRSVSRRMVSVFVPSSARMPPAGVFPFPCEYNITNSLTNSRMPSICLIVPLPIQHGEFQSLLQRLLQTKFHQNKTSPLLRVQAEISGLSFLPDLNKKQKRCYSL